MTPQRVYGHYLCSETLANKQQLTRQDTTRNLSLTLDIKFSGALGRAGLVLGPTGDETCVLWQSAEDGQC